MSLDEGPPGPATSLLRSLVRLGGTLLATAHSRVELLTTEVREDLERGVRVLLWALIAAMSGVLALLLAGIAVIVWFWDTHRMGATIGVTVAFALIATVAAWLARERLHEKPRLLDATLNELHRDVEALRREL
jgi:uncharacterized membrane protein YqjE